MPILVNDSGFCHSCDLTTNKSREVLIVYLTVGLYSDEQGRNREMLFKRMNEFVIQSISPLVKLLVKE